MLHAYHLTARARPSQLVFRAAEPQAALWKKLRLRFPKTYACVFMPNHLHLLVAALSAQEAKLALATELRAWTRRFLPGQQIWEPLPTPARIPDFFHLKRQIRYVHLNPCRAGLARDPLEWEWSTHRDVVQCVADPWPDLSALAQVFDTSRARLAEVMHRYISSDPTVAVAGTPPVLSAETAGRSVTDLSQILKAASMSLRKAPVLSRSQARDIAVHVSSKLNLIPDPTTLKMTRSTWNRVLLREIDSQALQTTLKILTDPRLLAVPKSQRG